MSEYFGTLDNCPDIEVPLEDTVASEKTEEEEEVEARLGEYERFIIFGLLIQPGRWVLILRRQIGE